MSAESMPARGDADGALDERSIRVLAFEGRAWQHAGLKAEGILGELIDSPAALRHDPMLVKRLQRMREARAATRARRSLSIGRPLD
jgi:hypothetical protein